MCRFNVAGGLYQCTYKLISYPRPPTHASSRHYGARYPAELVNPHGPDTLGVQIPEQIRDLVAHKNKAEASAKQVQASQ